MERTGRQRFSRLHALIHLQHLCLHIPEDLTRTPIIIRLRGAPSREHSIGRLIITRHLLLTALTPIHITQTSRYLPLDQMISIGITTTGDHGAAPAEMDLPSLSTSSGGHQERIHAHPLEAAHALLLDQDPDRDRDRDPLEEDLVTALRMVLGL